MNADSLTDSVRIVISYGLGGTVVVFAAPGQPRMGAVLAGRTETYDDSERGPTGGPILVGPAQATRVACAGPAR